MDDTQTRQTKPDRAAAPVRINSLSPSFGLYATEPVQRLRDKGWEVNTLPPDLSLDRASVMNFLQDCDAMVLGTVRVDREMMAALPRLKAIVMHGAGLDHIDLEGASQLGIAVCNSPGGNARAVAELTVGLMFSLARRIPWCDGLLKQGGWAMNMGMGLEGRTLGIVGLGRIGKELTRLAAGLGMRVAACGRTHDQEFTARHGVAWLSLPELLAAADFVSIHLPGSPQTAGLIGAAELALLRPGSCLLNLGRGGVVDEEALYQSLVQGHLAGAGLDVFAHEPVGESPLVQLPQVVATPHMGGFTLEAAARTGSLCAQNLEAVLEGRMPSHLVNRWSPSA